MSDSKNNLTYFEERFLELDKKVSTKGYIGWDPRQLWYLPLSKRYHAKKTRLRNFLRRAEVAILRYIPSLMKPYLKVCGIKEFESPYGLALLLSSYSNAYIYYQDDKYLNKAIDVAQALEKHLIVTESGFFGVGVPFENEKVSNLPAGAEVALAFLNLYNITENVRYLDTAESIADSFVNDHAVKKIDKCIVLDYYTNNDGLHVLNANALAADVMHKIKLIKNNEKYDIYINGIVNYLRRYVNKDRIPYSGIEDSKINSNWLVCDSYHTGFTIRGFFSIVDEDVYMFFLNYNSIFLSDNGTLKVLERSKITDIHSVAEYVRLFAFCLKKDKRILKWLDSIKFNIEYMTFEDSFYYQRGVVDNSIYMPRWGHFAMMLALSELLLVGIDHE